jgi:hypothetical protein
MAAQLTAIVDTKLERTPSLPTRSECWKEWTPPSVAAAREASAG